MASEQVNKSRWSESTAPTPGLTIASVRSAHPEMESIHDQPDQGMRTTDFFDDTTDDDVSTKATKLKEKSEDDLLDPPKSPTAYFGGLPAEDLVTKCKDDEELKASPRGSPSRSSLPFRQGMDGFIRLTQSPGPKQKHWPRPPERPPRPLSEASASYDFGETAVVGLARPLSMQRTASGQLVAMQTTPTIVVEDTEESPTAAVASVEAAKDELIMNAHTQTLQALLRDETALQQASTRISFGPDTEHNTRPAAKKRVSLAPLPLDMIGGSLPDDLVRTPYPLNFRKVYSRPSPIRTSLKTEHESILPITIRRCGGHSHRPQRITHVTLPAEVGAQVDMTQASPATKEKHFESLDWDDAYLFSELRAAYSGLAGPYRIFSARSLQSIRLSHSNDDCSCTRGDHPLRAQSSMCGHTVPRSPRYLESKGLTDSFSEQELLKYFRSPRLGKSRYAWVHWAKRMSSCPSHLRSPAPDPPADSPAARLAKIREEEETSKDGSDENGVLYTDCAASLEFVEGWSWPRIMLALISVNACALIAALCWIFLGSDLSPYTTGYRDAGERVTGGAILGVFVLLIGWTSVGGWLVLSSLVG